MKTIPFWGELKCGTLLPPFSDASASLFPTLLICVSSTSLAHGFPNTDCTRLAGILFLLFLYVICIFQFCVSVMEYELIYLFVLFFFFLALFCLRSILCLFLYSLHMTPARTNSQTLYVIISNQRNHFEYIYIYIFI